MSMAILRVSQRPAYLKDTRPCQPKITSLPPNPLVSNLDPTLPKPLRNRFLCLWPHLTLSQRCPQTSRPTLTLYLCHPTHQRTLTILWQRKNEWRRSNTPANFCQVSQNPQFKRPNLWQLRKFKFKNFQRFRKNAHLILTLMSYRCCLRCIQANM